MKNALLSDDLVKEEIRKEVKDVLEFNENEGTVSPNLWDTMKAVLRGKLTVLSANKKKLERTYHICLREHLKTLEHKKLIHPRGVEGWK